MTAPEASLTLAHRSLERRDRLTHYLAHSSLVEGSEGVRLEATGMQILYDKLLCICVVRPEAALSEFKKVKGQCIHMLFKSLNPGWQGARKGKRRGM